MKRKAILLASIVFYTVISLMTVNLALAANPDKLNNGGPAVNAETLIAEADAYYDGVDVNQDFAKALADYRKAAALGNGYAMNMVGVMYDDGQSVKADPVEAVDWFTKAADTGYPTGWYNLGGHYRDGLGVKADPAKALALYRQAADAGQPLAMTQIGDFYYAGLAVDKDDAEAASWYQKAVDAGAAEAYWRLALRYVYGEGVGRDTHKAAQLGYQALLAGVPEARDNLDKARKTDLPPNFLKEVQQLLSEDGFYKGKVDGSYGPATVAAVDKAFNSKPPQ